MRVIILIAGCLIILFGGIFVVTGLIENFNMDENETIVSDEAGEDSPEFAQGINEKAEDSSKIKQGSGGSAAQMAAPSSSPATRRIREIDAQIEALEKQRSVLMQERKVLEEQRKLDQIKSQPQ